jgi:predicted outer membrane repeat protein
MTLRRFTPFCLGAALALTAAARAQTVLFVNAGLVTGTGSGQSWANAFRGPAALQKALDAAAPIAAGGQTVQLWVAAGTHVPGQRTNPADPNSASFQLLSKVELYGGFAGTETLLSQRNVIANPTILSGLLNPGQAYHVVTTTGVDSTCILDGVTVRDGLDVEQASAHGGGIFNIGGSPLVRFCTIRNNQAIAASAPSGGGVYSPSGAPRFEDCTFTQNNAAYGGALQGQATLVRCTFTSNTIDNGQGGAIDTTGVTCQKCTFTGNSCSLGAGGAISGPATLTDCSFVSNGSDGGGALYGGPFTAVRCAFQTNTAHDGEGAVSLTSGQSSTFTDCTFSQNDGSSYSASAIGGGTAPLFLFGCRFLQNPELEYLSLPAGSQAVNCFSSENAGGVLAGNGVSFINCTFRNSENDQRGALFTAGAGVTITVTNCVFWDYRGGPALQSHNLNNANGGVFHLSRSDVQGLDGTLGGVGNFSADPRLAADGSLLSPSPCIDAGNSAAVPAGVATDAFGQPRFVDDPGMPNTGAGTPPVDIGAFEFQGTTCYANCDGSTTAPILNVIDFTCFLQSFASGNPYANCDGSTTPPVLNLLDFTCFLQKFAGGCL